MNEDDRSDDSECSFSSIASDIVVVSAKKKGLLKRGTNKCINAKRITISKTPDMHYDVESKDLNDAEFEKMKLSASTYSDGPPPLIDRPISDFLDVGSYEQNINFGSQS